MALLGSGALAMWWDIALDMRAEFEDWHTHEHFPERMRVPGFRRGSRWADADGGEGFFILYEMESYATLTSPEYRAHLNAPTPWSAKMMPHHRNMVRSQCHVLESVGGALSRFMLTLRLSPADADRLRPALRDLAATIANKRGIASGHLLRTETPALAQTTEQKIRGGDAAADWIFLAAGYERDALEALAKNELGDAALIASGAKPGAVRGLYTLSHTNSAAEFTPKA
ncbi:MAG: hypothetical protein JNJ97_08435 [Alphaproteobacteria bacterium]|nr:hypothetical protein [Alphaproteobacteria bacterium]MCA0451180.1 hypothetical protein [Pseudomonadota bacterium]